MPPVRNEPLAIAGLEVAKVMVMQSGEVDLLQAGSEEDARIEFGFAELERPADFPLEDLDGGGAHREMDRAPARSKTSTSRTA